MHKLPNLSGLECFFLALYIISCVFVFPLCAGAGEKGVKVELDKPSDPS